MKIYRDGKEIELTSEERVKAYEEQVLINRICDAEDAVRDYCSYIGKYNDVEFDYELIAQRFIDRFECDQAENDQFYEIVREYIDDYEEFKEGEAK